MNSLYGGGLSSYGPIPDVGVLFKNKTSVIIEVASKTDKHYFRAPKGLIARNRLHILKNNLNAVVKVSENAKWFDAAVSTVKGWFCRS